MENNPIPKIVSYAKLESKMKAERRKLRWLDDVQADLKIIGIKRWRRQIQDRSEWMRSNCENHNAIEEETEGHDHFLLHP
jgi:hypothetical protein